MTQLELFEDNAKLRDCTNHKEHMVCIDCQENKPMSDYYDYGYKTLSGVHRRCKPCYNLNSRKLYHLKKENPYPHMNPVCDCCGALGENEALALDHDHRTDKFRGFLCRSCNTGIGSLGDTLEGLYKAVSYLKRHYDE